MPLLGGCSGVSPEQPADKAIHGLIVYKSPERQQKRPVTQKS
jgi:hypothetical protein